MLQLEPLEKAISSLEKVLIEQARVPDNEFVRDAAIQRFEYSYDISHKMLKRHLEMTSANPAEYDGMSFQNLIRSGNEKGLLKSDWPQWKIYRHSRNITSHTYDEEKAKEILNIIPTFYEEAKFLLHQLHDHNQ